jgi:hypothetical protein
MTEIMGVPSNWQLQSAHIIHNRFILYMYDTIVSIKKLEYVGLALVV